jgi:hypothetical protein
MIDLLEKLWLNTFYHKISFITDSFLIHVMHFMFMSDYRRGSDW